MITPYFHGISVRDAAMMLGVPEQNIRTWKKRHIIVTTGDGQICPRNLVDWYENTRNEVAGGRGEIHQSKSNPYRETQ